MWTDTKSSHAGDRLTECYAVLSITSLKVAAEDVVTLCVVDDSGTCGAHVVPNGGDQVAREAEDITLLFSSVEWCVMRLLLTGLDPFIYIPEAGV